MRISDWSSDVCSSDLAVGRSAAHHPGAALVELQPDGARHLLLAVVDRRLQHLTLGAEPESVVDKLGIAWGKLVLQVSSTPLQRELHDSAMRGVEDGPARRQLGSETCRERVGQNV